MDSERKRETVNVPIIRPLASRWPGFCRSNRLLCRETDIRLGLKSHCRILFNWIVFEYLLRFEGSARRLFITVNNP